MNAATVFLICKKLDLSPVSFPPLTTPENNRLQNHQESHLKGQAVLAGQPELRQRLQKRSEGEEKRKVAEWQKIRIGQIFESGSLAL